MVGTLTPTLDPDHLRISRHLICSGVAELRQSGSFDICNIVKGNTMELLGQALGLGTIGLVAGLVGAVIAAFATRSQTSTLTSYVQHFEIGRASCREREEMSGADAALL